MHLLVDQENTDVFFANISLYCEKYSLALSLLELLIVYFEVASL